MKQKELFEIVENISLKDQDFILKLRLQHGQLDEVKPGNFVQLLIPHSSDTFLRRPISVCDVDCANKILWLYIKKVGKGTRELAKCKKGELLDILFPLGNGFNFEQSRNPLLLGGGVGIAPMVYLSKKISAKGIRPTVLLAGKTAESLEIRTLFDSGKCNLQLATDDGSLGEKGLIVNHSIMQHPADFDCVFCCGPTPMMKAVAKIMETAQIPCQVSLENHMACGIGACLCCVTPTKEKGNQCVCTEGPVFNSKELAW